MKKIKLTQDKVVVVDNKWFEMLKYVKWHAKEQGDKYFYAATMCKGCTRMHDVIMDTCSIDKKKYVIDHINRDTLDNRVSNLRIITRSINSVNQKKRKSTSSKYKGVYFDNAVRKWCSCMRINGIYLNLGRFKSEKEAAEMYDNVAKEWYGSYAVLNFNN